MKRKSKIFNCHTLSVCPGLAENMGMGIGQAEHRLKGDSWELSQQPSFSGSLNPIPPGGTDDALRIGMFQTSLNNSAGTCCLTVCLSC